jgi:surface polysaccharide O-acyltransferase-like enzyme
MSRNRNADLLKTISIFGVVYIHGSSLLGGGDILNFIRENFRFAVPCFIILWSYFFDKSYKKKTEKEKTNYIFNRFIHLFRVYFIWSLLYFILTVNWEQLTFQTLFTTHFLGYGWAGQYFFIIIFQLLFLFPVLKKTYQINFIRISIITILTLIYILYGYSYELFPSFIKKIDLRPFIYWIPYVYFGIYLNTSKLPKSKAIIILLPLFIGIEFLILNQLDKEYSYYITPITLIVSILFTINILNLKLETFNKKTEKLIEFIANNTLVIFISNPLFVIIAKKILSTTGLKKTLLKLSGIETFTITIFLIVLIFILTLILIKIINKIGLKKILT